MTCMYVCVLSFRSITDTKDRSMLLYPIHVLSYSWRLPKFVDGNFGTLPGQPRYTTVRYSNLIEGDDSGQDDNIFVARNKKWVHVQYIR